MKMKNRRAIHDQCRLAPVLSGGLGILAAKHQLLNQRMRAVLAAGCGGNNERHGPCKGYKDGLRMRQLADFGRCESNAFSGRNQGKQRGQVLDTMPA